MLPLILALLNSVTDSKFLATYLSSNLCKSFPAHDKQSTNGVKLTYARFSARDNCVCMVYSVELWAMGLA